MADRTDGDPLPVTEIPISDLVAGDGRGNVSLRRHGEPPMIDIGSFVPAYLTFIATRWSRSASKLYLQRFGIGIEAWRILSLLAIKGPMTAQRIVNTIFMDKASVSRNLRSLHEAGLVTLTSDPEDARQRFAELTQAGFAVHDQIIVVALDRADRLTACLSDDEMQTFLSLLERVNAHLPALDEEEALDGGGEDKQEPSA